MSTQVTPPTHAEAQAPGRFRYSLAQVALAQSDLTTIGQYMFWLMFRNVASDGLVFESPPDPGNQPSPPVQSLPGCILASPTWEDTGTHVNQDYVFNWTRDAAVVAIELAAGPLPTSQPLINYVQFAQTCQNSASAIGHFGRASFLINGTPRNWSDQTDGPALQTLAILQMYAQLDAPTQAVASAVIAANLNFLQNAYQGDTVNLWEEESGASFFARSVQLKCFQAISANTLGIGVPGWLSTAIPWLQNALASHWNGRYYRSLLPSRATAALLTTRTSTSSRRQSTARSRSPTPSSWRPPHSCAASGPTRRRRTITRSTAPTSSAASAPCSGAIRGTPTTATPPTRRRVTIPGPFPPLSSRSSTTSWRSRSAAAERFRSTACRPPSSARSESTPRRPRPLPPRRCRGGRRDVQALVFHSDHFELSEQFDATSGYEKSVSDLSWSYASFLSAVRAKNAI